MHIALVILTLGPGGAERVLSQLANAWQEEGHHITLITLEHPSQKPFYPLNPNIHLIQLNPIFTKPTSWFEYLKNITTRLLLLRRTLKKEKPDLILSFIDQINVLTLLLTRGLKIPVIVSERIDPAFHPLSRIYKILRRLTYPWASQIVVQTQSAANYFSKKLQKKISIIPNSVFTPKKALTYQKIQHIVSVGRLSPQKDYPTLLKAFKVLTIKYPFLKLTIYGEGKERFALERYIQTLDLNTSVHLPGIISNIEQALLKADLFVFPSKFEGFPNALCEAMSLGLPVVASNCSGNRDIIQNEINGLLFPIGNYKILTQQIERLLFDPFEAQRIGKKAKNISQTYSEQKILTLWHALIKKVLQST
ncbi:MAG: glycosyltransferase family 4 protein [Proteobacteria bacterium]|nr:glycosyltransferase family 4 protein [Pseudomonadota bacterium]